MRFKWIIILFTLLLPLLNASHQPNEAGIYEVESCEGEETILSCPSGSIINDISANYGRLSINVCNKENADYSTSCHTMHTSTTLINQRCQMKESCSVRASMETFGHPISDITKNECPFKIGSFYFTATYKCIEKNDDKLTTTSSTTVGTSTVSIVNEKIDERDEPVSYPPLSHSSIECPSIMSHGIKWSSTKGGSRSITKCPFDSYGEATWSCLSNGIWSSEGPILTKCSSKDLSDVSTEIKNAKHLKLKDNLDKAIRNFNLVIKEKVLLGNDLSIVLDTVIEMITVLSHSSTFIDESKKDEYRKRLIDGMNGVIQSHSLWESGWTKDEERGFASRYIDMVEKLYLSASIPKDTTPKTFGGDNKPIIGQFQSIIGDNEISQIRFPSTNMRDVVIIPSEVFHIGDKERESINVFFSSINGLSKYIPSRKRLISDESRIVSNIVTLSLINDSQVEHISLKKDTIRVIFSHSDYILDGMDNPRCVWWDKDMGRGGDWSTIGCSLIYHTSMKSECKCNHMTHYAVLMDLSGKTLSDTNTIVLTWLTYGGCSLSICCLLVSFISFIIFSRNGGYRLFVHKNLCLTLASAQAFFLIAIFRNSDIISCRIISCVLLYLFLSSLLWMLVEGFQLYLLLVEVFSTHSRRLQYTILCYILPAFIVFTAVFIDKDAMGSGEYCWLRPNSNVFIFTFIIPSMVIMIFNWIFLIMALCIVRRRSSKGYMPCKYQGETKPKTLLKGSMALAALLGVTWSLGFLWINNDSSIIVAYSFTILNSLQGLFIFLFHVVFNDKMRSDMNGWFTRRGLNCSSSSSMNSPDDDRSRRITKTFSPSNDSTSLFIGGETCDRSNLPRSLYGHPAYSSHHHHYQLNHQHKGDSLDRTDYDGCNNSTYDYATIAYGDMIHPNHSHPHPSSSYIYNHDNHNQYNYRPSSHLSYCPPPYMMRNNPYPLYGGVLSSIDGIGGTRIGRLPPPHTLPPQPPLSSPSLPPIHSTPLPPSSNPPSSSNRPSSSDDSAYSDSSSMFTSEVTVDGSTVLRMDLKRNPPLFQQDL